MKKIKLLSVFLATAIVVCSGQNWSSGIVNAKNMEYTEFDVSSSQFTLAKSPQLSYTVYGFTSVDDDVPDEYKNSSQYIENYSIEFSYPDTTPKLHAKSSNIVTSGTVDIMNSNSITIPTSKISKLGTEAITIPLFTREEKKQIFTLSDDGIQSVLRSISINVFYSKSESENTLNDTNDTMFVQKSNLSTIATNSSQQQNFKHMYAIVYVQDEYSGSKKRQSFSAYHMKYSPLNKMTEGLKYINTSLKDGKSDVISLGWSLGGAISLNDPSITFEGGYNLQCEVCQMKGRTQYAYNSFKQNSSEISKHDSLFTRNSVGYNIPDVGRGYCKYCGEPIATRPAALHITAKGAWYNKGSYNGTSGVVRTEYCHTYSNRSIVITPSISVPGSVSFGISIAENQNYEKSWVYAVISPN